MEAKVLSQPPNTKPHSASICVPPALHATLLCHRNRRLSPSSRTLVQRLFDLSPLVFSAQPSLSPFLVYTGLVARYQVFVAASEFFSFFFFFFFFFRERQRRGGESFSSVTTLFLKREGKMGQVL